MTTFLLHELRLAIHMTHDCEATDLVEVFRVQRDKSSAVIEVFLFNVSGTAESKRCFVWQEQISETRAIGHAKFQTTDIRTPEQAVGLDH